MRASLSQRFKDTLEHSLRLLEHLVVPESEHVKSRPREITRSIEVFEQPLGMLTAVNFDNQPSPHANEIRNVVTKRHLAAEPITAELTIAHKSPEASLGVGGVCAQSACIRE